MLRSTILFAILFFFNTISYAVSSTCWLTGPLLAPAGHTIPRGHTNFEIYGINFLAFGRFNAEGLLTRTPLFRSTIANPILTHGFTDWMDVQVSIPYAFNSTQGRSFQHIGDVSTALGFQLLEQKKSRWKPDLRLAIQETYPTGRFERLRLDALSTDSTGLGAYQTLIALNFQRLDKIFKTHFLRTRLSLSRIHFSPVSIHGLSTFGGSPSTRGVISSSFENDAILAFEFSMTKHWVLVMEGYISQGNANHFNGIANVGNVGGGAPVNIGSGSFLEEALTPAIEYNFNAHVGVIGGLWFPVKSINTANFRAYLLALNAYW